MTILPLAGWMLVAPLNVTTANEQLRVGRVHSIGKLHDSEIEARIPFSPGDRVCWIDTPSVHVLNETLLLVPLNTPVAYEPQDEYVQVNGHGDAQPDVGADG